jgi:hypothetical protein
VAQSSADRRKYPRLRTEQMISLAPLEAADRLAVGKNLSAGGICFEAVGCEFALGDLLRVTFNVSEETVVAVGRVTWAIELDAFTQEVGIEFVEIDPFALAALEREAPE